MLMESSNAVRRLGALAQESRLAAFRALVQAGPGGIAAGELAETLGIAPPTLSFHLAALANAGLVTATRNGRSIIYVAAFDAMNELVGFLTENCCGRSAGCARPPKSGAVARATRARPTKARSPRNRSLTKGERR